MEKSFIRAFSKNDRSRPQFVFIFMGLFYGLTFLILTPPFQAPDEILHFYKSYHVSEGNFISKKQGDLVGDWLPLSLTATAASFNRIAFKPENKVSSNEILSLFHLPLNRQNRGFTNFKAAALYSPLSYLPQATGIFIFRILNPSPLLLMYAGRAFNLLAWLTLIFFAIRTAPVFKWAFTFIALTPMSLFQAASLSEDPFLNAASLLFIAYLLKGSLEKTGPIDLSELTLLILLSLMIALAKPGYLFITLLFFLLPKKRFKNTAYYIAAFGLIFGLSLLASLGWAFITKSFFVPNPSNTNVIPPQPLSALLSHPFGLIPAVLKTWSANALNYPKQYIGVFGWLDTPLPTYVWASILGILILVALFDKNPMMPISIQKKILMFDVFLITSFIIFLSLHIVNTTVSGIITRGQGRYFIPIAPLLFLLLYNLRIRWNLREKPMTLDIALIAMNMLLCSSVITLFKRYYVP